MYGPNKKDLFPNSNIESVCYIANLEKQNNVEIGDYTYYSDNDASPTNFYNQIKHHYDFIGDKLIIGKFCQIASGIKFIMNGANHKMDGITTYPFYIFAHGWEKVTPQVSELPFKGDTVIGNDVWFGESVTIMPGVHIGSGAVIATNSVVTSNVEPYAIYGGNPARKIKMRYNEQTIKLLLEFKWWDLDEEILFSTLEQLTVKSSDEEIQQFINNFPTATTE